MAWGYYSRSVSTRQAQPQCASHVQAEHYCMLYKPPCAAQGTKHIQHRPRDGYFLYRDFAIVDCVFSRDCPRSFEPEVPAFTAIHAALACMNYTLTCVLTDLIKMIMERY